MVELREQTGVQRSLTERLVEWFSASNRVHVFSELRTPRSLTIDTNEKQANVSSPM